MRDLTKPPTVCEPLSTPIYILLLERKTIENLREFEVGHCCAPEKNRQKETEGKIIANLAQLLDWILLSGSSDHI